MADGSAKSGDAKADVSRDEFDENSRERELAITRLEIRAQMRSENEIEDSSVIDQKALEAQRRKSSVPPAKEGVMAILLVPLKVKTGYQLTALVAVIFGLLVALYLKR